MAKRAKQSQQTKQSKKTGQTKQPGQTKQAGQSQQRRGQESKQEPGQESQQDWISSVVDAIVDNIAKVRKYGTENAIVATRAIVYGLVAMVVLVVAVILLVIIGLRLADAYLPIGAGVGDAVWAAHLLIGSLLAILGFGFWLNRKREKMRAVAAAIIIDVAIIVVIVCYGIINSFV